MPLLSFTQNTNSYHVQCILILKLTKKLKIKLRRCIIFDSVSKANAGFHLDFGSLLATRLHSYMSTNFVKLGLRYIINLLSKYFTKSKCG